MTPAQLITEIKAFPFNPIPSANALNSFLAAFPEPSLPSLTNAQYNGTGSTASFCYNILSAPDLSFDLMKYGGVKVGKLGNKANPVLTNIANAIADAKKGVFAGLRAKHHLSDFPQEVLLKILSIYVTDEFITVGDEYTLTLLSKILGVGGSDLIELNHNCLGSLLALDPVFATYPYNQLGCAIDEVLGPRNREDFKKWIKTNITTKSGTSSKTSYPHCIETLSIFYKTNYYAKSVLISTLKTLYTKTLADQKNSGGKYYGSSPSYGTNMYYSAAVNEYINFLTKTTSSTAATTSSVTTASPAISTSAASPVTFTVPTTPKRSYPKNLILYGPPGTGKTYNTIRYAVSIIDGIDVDDVKDDNTYTDASGSSIDVKKEFDSYLSKDQIRFTTFHQSLSYEDFIEGIKPVYNKKDKVLKYPVIPGIFKQICKAAKEQADKAKQAGQEPENYVLVIDEINRGNVAQIFGELITLIEEDKREGEVNAIPVTLPYSSTEDPKAPKFTVPSNLYILGTMNTADRSVEALDSALRRRFTFIEMRPDASKVPVSIAFTPPGTTSVTSIALRKVFENINRRIEVLKDAEHQIGHSYFMGVDTVEKLMKVFQHKIIPLLQEYFFGDTERIKMVIGDKFFTTLKDIKKNVFPGYKGDVDFPEEILQIWDETKWKECWDDPTRAVFIAAIDALTT